MLSEYIAPFAALSLAGLATAQKLTCPQLATGLRISGLNVTVASADYVTAGSTIRITGGQALYCQNTTVPLVDVCRVTFNIATSNRSSTYTEVWLPSGKDGAWSGRTVATGNGGLNGCVDYAGLVYTTSLGFSAFGDNGGHDSNAGNGSAFLNNNDIILDFAWRARHSTVVLGKQVVQQYYGQLPTKSYYFGCSTAGRQGLKAAQMFPNDFDGIVAGAPASDFNHLGAWSGHFLTLTGANSSDPRFLSRAQWTAVHAEVLNQCDGSDGVVDGILEDSSICNFNPETLLCSRSKNASTTCLTTTQAQTVRNVFLPYYGVNNTFLYPRLSPGAELAAAVPAPFSYLDGNLIGPGTGWFRNAIYNDVNWNPATLNALDVAYADSLDAQHGYISSFSGDLSAFKNRGGKLISYHGGADSIITGEQSMRYYNHVADTMSLSNTQLDDFYRLFRISGMGHCSGGSGAWAIGQTLAGSSGKGNVLLDLVNWVENGKAPEKIIGTKFVNDTASQGVAFERPHCRYPYRTTYQGENPNITSSWGCNYISDWNVCGGPSSRLPKLC
jgi:feruloyl esterase